MIIMIIITTIITNQVEFCSNILGGANFLVCEYSPPGNVQGRFDSNVARP